MLGTTKQAVAYHLKRAGVSTSRCRKSSPPVRTPLTAARRREIATLAARARWEYHVKVSRSSSRSSSSSIPDRPSPRVWPYLVSVPVKGFELLLLTIATLLPVGLPEAIRAEVGQEAALAVWSGAVTESNLHTALTTILRDVRRTHPSLKTPNLSWLGWERLQDDNEHAQP